MQKGGDDPLLVEPPCRREIDHIDAAQLAVARLGDKPLDLGDRFRIGRLAQYRKQPLGFARQRLGHLLEASCNDRMGAPYPLRWRAPSCRNRTAGLQPEKTEVSGG